MAQKDDCALLSVKAEALHEALQCPICLEVSQLPVNLCCFQGCRGVDKGQTCFRSLVCQHCANLALQLHKPASSRFVHTQGQVRCLICRETAVDAVQLVPARAYSLNYNIMEVMDLLKVQSTCRKCSIHLDSQFTLLKHYRTDCPHAVVKCKFSNCTFNTLRSQLRSHEDCCPIGRAMCSQCQAYVDRTDLLIHMVTSCKNRMVSCVMCSHRARLPDMLEHLKLHQTELHLKLLHGAAGPQFNNLSGFTTDLVDRKTGKMVEKHHSLGCGPESDRSST